MLQLLQYFDNGKIELKEVPVPKTGRNQLLVKSAKSLISTGTERMLLSFGKGSYLEKIKQQPEKVKQVLDKIRTEGLITTYEMVKNKLSDPIPLGYSNVGQIIEKGNLIENFKIGDRVVSNGPHAEIVRVPNTLAAKVPDNVTDDEACFTILGSIALQGLRLAKPQIGETVVVIGLGLLGQLSLQLASANGCRVVGFDIDENKVELARKLGYEAYQNFDSSLTLDIVNGGTNGIGADIVLVTVATKSETLMAEAAQLCRKKGRLIQVGVAPINFPRSIFYEKEISFQVSSSYGPGRYDQLYEEKGIDYPLPYVRFTAQRNMETILGLMEEKKLNLKPLITHQFNFHDAEKAYDVVMKENPLAVLLNYLDGKVDSELKKVQIKKDLPVIIQQEKVVVGFNGVGNFAKAVLLPAIKKTEARIKSVCSSDGYSAVIGGGNANADEATSDFNSILKDKQINTIFISTRHLNHANLTLKALEMGKHVFVEKPLALNLDELKQIYDFYANNQAPILMVGFNRRFSPFAVKLRERLQNRKNPISINVGVNAGYIPINHWVHDPEVGGGRWRGEGCHFVDLIRFLVGSSIRHISAVKTEGHAETDSDKIMANFTFEDGSIATISYLANGNKKYPKERVEVFSDNKVFLIDNFRKLESFGDKLKVKSLKQDKGHNAEVREFVNAIRSGGIWPIPVNEIMEVHLATFAVEEAIENNRVISMDDMFARLMKG